MPSKKTGLPKDVNAYIDAFPKEIRGKLREIRSVIKKTAPSVQEDISYGMPHYRHGGQLAYFGAFKNHISLFVPPPIIEEHQDYLTDYKTAKATIHFAIDKPLPILIIKKLIKARMKKNEAGIRNK